MGAEDFREELRRSTSKTKALEEANVARLNSTSVASRQLDRFFGRCAETSGRFSEAYESFVPKRW